MFQPYVLHAVRVSLSVHTYACTIYLYHFHAHVSNLQHFQVYLCLHRGCSCTILGIWSRLLISFAERAYNSCYVSSTCIQSSCYSVIVVHFGYCTIWVTFKQLPYLLSLGTCYSSNFVSEWVCLLPLAATYLLYIMSKVRRYTIYCTFLKICIV